MSRDAYEVNKAARGLEVSKIALPPAVGNFVTRTRRYANELGRTYRSQRDMTDVDRLGNEVRIGSRRKGMEAVRNRLVGTEGVRDYVETANRIGARRVGLQAEAAGQDGRSRAARAVRENKARQTSMEDRAVGEARRLRNVGFGLGAVTGLGTASTVATLHRDNRPVVKAKRINLNDIASLERQTAEQAKVVASAEANRRKVHARHDPVVAAAQEPRPARKKAVPAPAPKKRTTRPRPAAAAPVVAPRGRLVSPMWVAGGAAAATAGAAGALYLHRKRKQARLQAVGKAGVRVPKPKVGSVVRVNAGGHSRNATVGRASNGKRKMTFQTPMSYARPEGAKQTYNLQNFTTGPVWRAGGYAAANPGKTAAGVAGGATALGATYWAGTRSR